MTTQTKTKPQAPKLATWKALLLCLPMALLSAMMLTGGQLPADPLYLVTAGVTFLLINGAFFLMLTTGETHRYRSLLFVVMAVGFVITFITNLIETRGSMILTAENVISGETPFCHLVIPMIIVPAAFTYRTDIHRPVFDALIGERKEGFVQIDWTPLEPLPARIDEEVDVDGDGRADFRVEWDTGSDQATLTPYASWVLGLEGTYRLEDSLAVRVTLRNR